MNNRPTALVAALAALIAGCGGSSGYPENSEFSAAPQGNVIGRVEALSDRQRNALFIRAIRDAGLECQHVDWSTRSGTYRGMPVWTAACTRAQTWIIIVGGDGTAQVLNPAEGLVLYNLMDGEDRPGRR